MASNKKECPDGRPRDYADDNTLRVEGDTATGCSAKMHEQLEKLNSATQGSYGTE